MDWQIVCYGVIPPTNTFYVIQKSNDDYCLWVTDNPNHSLVDLSEVEEFLSDNETNGCSVSGSWDDIQEELKNELIRK